MRQALEHLLRRGTGGIRAVAERLAHLGDALEGLVAQRRSVEALRLGERQGLADALEQREDAAEALGNLITFAVSTGWCSTSSILWESRSSCATFARQFGSTLWQG